MCHNHYKAQLPDSSKIKLENINHSIKQAEGDTDVLIVNTVTNIASTS